jgi:signal peptidase I
MTTSHKLSSSLTGKASALTVLLMVAGILFAAPSAMAQQIALTPEELEQQRRLQDTIDATTRNLEQGEKEVNGIVFTPRWSNPVWVEADSLSILFAYCLPGEFADSGQEILGGSQLEVLESYALALTGDLMVWFAVVENEDEQNRLPAALGVICASDLNDAQTRVLSPQEQQEINNIIQQFITIQNTQVTNIENVINIINNVTTNGTTTGPITPPANDTGTTPPPANDTGTTPPTNETGGGGGPIFPDRGDVFPFENETLTIDPGEGMTLPPTNETGGGGGPIFPDRGDVFPFENETLTIEPDGGTISPQPPGGGGTVAP